MSEITKEWTQKFASDFKDNNKYNKKRTKVEMTFVLFRLRQ